MGERVKRQNLVEIRKIQVSLLYPAIRRSGAQGSYAGCWSSPTFDGILVIDQQPDIPVGEEHQQEAGDVTYRKDAKTTGVLTYKTCSIPVDPVQEVFDES